MAWKGRSAVIDDPNQLRAGLIDSKLNQDNPALFQGLNSVITSLSQLKDGLGNKFNIDDQLDLVNNVKDVLPIQNGGSFSGIYQPVATLITNLDSAGCDPTIYSRVGDTVRVSGLLTVNPTAAGLCECSITLPIKTYPIWDYQISGTSSAIVNIDHAGIYADIVNYKAKFSWIASVTSQYKMFFEFSYLIVRE